MRHSQGAIDALRDAPELARYNLQLAIVTIDPPRTSTRFRATPVRVTSICTQRIRPRRWIAVVPTSSKRRNGWVARHAAHAVRRTGPNRDYPRQDEVVDREPTHVAALSSNRHLYPQ